MIYLLDVNVLLAMGYTTHVHHALVWRWLGEQRAQHAPFGVKLATCAITELGFVRIASGGARLAASVREARSALAILKLREQMMFFSDRVYTSELPGWVTKSPQTTDGHLVMLARANGARLVTLDRSIPGAEVILNSAEMNPAPLDLAMQCRRSC